MRHHLAKIMLFVVIFVGFLGNVYASNEAAQLVPKQLKEAGMLHSILKDKIACLTKFNAALSAEIGVFDKELGTLHKKNGANNSSLKNLTGMVPLLAKDLEQHDADGAVLSDRLAQANIGLKHCIVDKQRLEKAYYGKLILKNDKDYKHALAGIASLPPLINDLNSKLGVWGSKNRDKESNLNSQQASLNAAREAKKTYESNIKETEAKIKNSRAYLPKSEAFKQKLSRLNGMLEFEISELKDIDIRSTGQLTVDRLRLASNSINKKISEIHTVLKIEGLPPYKGKPVCPN